MNITFDHCETENAAVSTFYFRSDQLYTYKAGQYVQITLDHPSPDNRGTYRSFTLSSAPGSELISITTRVVVESSSTFTQALRALHAGDTLKISKPKGSFVLPDDVEIPLLFVAGGVGITPFHSMLTWLESIGQRRQIKLLYAVRSESECIFQSMIEKLGRNAKVIVENPTDDWMGLSGQIKPETVVTNGQALGNALFYLSGPEAMVSRLAEGLLGLGITNDRIVVDALPSYLGL